MLTVPEAARRTGLHPETIRRWVRSGRLRSQKVGTQHLIDEDALDSLLEPAHIDLPPDWLPDDGKQIDWARIVREDRASH